MWGITKTPVDFGASFAGALDSLSVSAAAAYSVARRLLTSYEGPLIRVRRSSDSTELDIGYLANGGLDTAALLTFCGAGNGFVAKIYDQGANALHGIQATAGNQPRIVLSGAVETSPSGLLGMFGHAPGVRLTLPATGWGTVSVWSGYSVGQCSADPTDISGNAMVLGTIDSGAIESTLWIDGNLYECFGSTARKNTGNPTPSMASKWQYTVISQANDFKTRLKGTQIFSTATNTVSTNPGSNEAGFGGHSVKTMNGWSSEGIIFGEALSDADRDALEANQMAYYGVS